MAVDRSGQRYIFPVDAGLLGASNSLQGGAKESLELKQPLKEAYIPTSVTTTVDDAPASLLAFFIGRKLLCHATCVGQDVIMLCSHAWADLV